MKTYENFTEAYIDIAKDLCDNYEYCSSPRGMKIKEILGYQFRLSNPLARVPLVPERKMSIHYLIAELIWYLSGNDSSEWISKYSGFWKKISDDGKTANSAYGARIFRPHTYHFVTGMLFNWTQWDYVKQELKKDPDSRRAVIHIRLPQDSQRAVLDVPCTLSLQFFLREDKVHMVTSMRSSDLIFGLTYDVPAFTIFQELLAVQLSQELSRPIGLGSYTHLSASLHVYERHFDMLQKIASAKPITNISDLSTMPPMPTDMPIEALMDAEHSFSNAKDEAELFENYLVDVKQGTLRDPYWNDWRTILVSHRAMKLGNATAAKELLGTTNYSGFRFFADLEVGS